MLTSIGCSRSGPGIFKLWPTGRQLYVNVTFPDNLWPTNIMEYISYVGCIWAFCLLKVTAGTGWRFTIYQYHPISTINSTRAQASMSTFTCFQWTWTKSSYWKTTLGSQQVITVIWHSTTGKKHYRKQKRLNLCQVFITAYDPTKKSPPYFLSKWRWSAEKQARQNLPIRVFFSKPTWADQRKHYW